MKAKPDEEDGLVPRSRDASVVLGEIIGGLPLCRYHMLQYTAIVLIWIQAGAIGGMFPWLLADAKKSYSLDESEQAQLLACLKVGGVVGVPAFALINGAAGRRPVILFGLVWVAAWCVAMSLTRGFVSLSVVVMIGQPFIDISRGFGKMLIAEILPVKRRGLLLSLLHAFWQVGALLLISATFINRNYHYLVIWVLAMVSVALLVFAAVGIESPFWLLEVRGAPAARAALRRLAERCGVDSDELPPLPDTAAPKLSPTDGLMPACVDAFRYTLDRTAELCSRQLLRLTIVTVLIRTCLMTGMSIDIFLVELLEDNGHSAIASQVNMVLYTAKIGGCLLGSLLVDQLGAFIGVAVSELLLSFVLAADVRGASPDMHAVEHGTGIFGFWVNVHLAQAGRDAGLYIAIALMYACAETCWSTSDTYVNEAFPAANRAVAHTFTAAIGWAASAGFTIGGPSIVAELGASWFLRICTAFMVIGGLLVLLLRTETAGRPLT